MANINTEILTFLRNNPLRSSKEIYDGLNVVIGYATVKRALAKMAADNFINIDGKGKSTKYTLSPAYELSYSVNVGEYFKKEQDERQIRDSFNLSLISGILNSEKLFTIREGQHLDSLQQKFTNNIAKLSPVEYDKEFERLAIDLSWKSSQIEGNTYSLLETERLLKEKETAAGKPKDDATMLLNHKEAINFIVAHPDYISPLTIRGIEDVHSILIKELKIDRNIRRTRIGISGTNYKPLDNDHQIREALTDMCTLVNSKENIFEKAILTLVLLSYIQAFTDGNKKTARIVSNAILIANKYCPISYRTVDSIEYKMAMLIFYEQNNVSAIKELFITQFEFAVNTYF